MTGREIAVHNREAPVATELGGDLPIQPGLVVFYRQEQVGTTLGFELKKAGEVCRASALIISAIRLSR